MWPTDLQLVWVALAARSKPFATHTDTVVVVVHIALLPVLPHEISQEFFLNFPVHENACLL
jgi:hypothetical protein